jgi:outer membrane autotransporter protein
MRHCAGEPSAHAPFRHADHAARIRHGPLGATLLAALGLALAAATPSMAQNWNGTTSTDWFTGSNWDGGAIPNSGTHPVLDTVTLHATVVGAPGAVSGSITVGSSGTGALTIQNGGALSNGVGQIGEFVGSSGTVTVTDAGSSFINSGNFVVGVNGTGAVTIQNGGALATGSAVIAGGLGSSGTVTVTDAGSSWTNTSNLLVGAGGTGTLTIQNGATSFTGNALVGFSSNGTVIVTGAGSSWIDPGTLLVGQSGTGTLTIQNGGTVNVGGDAVIAQNAGSTGTLNIGAASGQPAAAPGTFNASSVAFGAGTGLIVFNHTASNYVFAPTISGAGAVEVDAGTTILPGTEAYTGATTINGGTLSVTGSIAGSSGVTINAGATLNGTGIVSAITVNSGGTLMPGLPGAVGTLSGASVTFNAGSTYQVTIQGLLNSMTQLTGAATLNSSASVVIANGSSVVVGNKYTILTTTGTISGTFNPTVTFGSGLAGTLSYDAHDVFLTLNLASLAPLLPAGTPPNAGNVANAIDNFVSGGGSLPAGFQTIFTLPQSQIVNALTQLSGEEATGAQLSGFQLMNQFMALLIDPLADGHGRIGIGAIPFAPEQQTIYTPDIASAYAAVFKVPPALAPAYNPWRAWGAAYGGSSSINGDPNGVGHDVTTRAGGFAAGLDYLASPDTRIGFALAGAATGWDLATNLGGGHSDAFQAGLYGTHRFGDAYLSGALAFANYWAKTSRTVTVAGTDTLTASFDAQSLGGRIEGGYRLQPVGPAVTITPYAALQAVSFHAPAYSETAASGSPQFALSFNAQTSDAERAELGAWFSDNILLPRRNVLTLFGRVAWAHDWFDNLALTPSFQGLPGASFIVSGVAPPADLALVTAGAEWRLHDRWSLMGRFDGEFGNGAQTYTGTARVRYTW